MKEQKIKSDALAEEVAFLKRHIENLHLRLLDAANVILEEIEAINHRIASGEANKGLSREDIVMRNYVMSIANKIQMALR